jgi:dTDP-4-dehydrorhamnose reductase
VILVTGATGLLGCSLVEQALLRGHEVVALGFRNEVPLGRARPVRADLTLPGEPGRLVQRENPQWLVHCAAATDVDWCESHPDEALWLNAEVPRAMATALKAGGGRMVYVSTDAVYRGDRGQYQEEDECVPCNVYGRTKLAGERAVSEVLPDALILRTNLFGFTRTSRTSLAQWVLRELEAGRRVPAFSDVVFSPLFTDDLSNAILDMMRSELGGLFNLGGRSAISKHGFALKLAESFGLDASLVDAVPASSAPFKAPRPRNTSLVCARAEGRLGRPMEDLDSGIARFTRAYRTYRRAGRAERAG